MEQLLTAVFSALLAAAGWVAVQMARRIDERRALLLDAAAEERASLRACEDELAHVLRCARSLVDGGLDDGLARFDAALMAAHRHRPWLCEGQEKRRAELLAVLDSLDRARAQWSTPQALAGEVRTAELTLYPSRVAAQGGAVQRSLIRARVATPEDDREAEIEALSRVRRAARGRSGNDE
ncbi:MAG: hypothetical protein SFX73_00885 [Kofleriaceae bacterium]|nr:hypothetical protein [Kofleriaceae bacterium]